MNAAAPGIAVLGTGSALGARIQTNDAVCAAIPGLTPDWIIEKTGIRQRFHLGPGETGSGLAATAARAAMAAAGVAAADIGLVIACTFSHDYAFPPLAVCLHRDLGLKGAHAFDIQANCAAFPTALTLAADRMRADPGLSHALLVGCEVLSPFVDPGDIDTAVYFSDGAGALVLGPGAGDCGPLGAAFFTDSSTYEAVRLRAGGSGYPGGTGDGGFMAQNGLATWKQAVTHLPPTLRAACARAGLGADQIDLFVLHQANERLIDYVLRKLKVDPARAVVNVDAIGNTGAASIPIALDAAVAAGRLKPGDTVALAGVGAGFTFGATVWRWGEGVAP